MISNYQMIFMQKFMKYKYINHTADIEFNAFGFNLNQLFKNSELALFDTIADINKIKNSKPKTNKIIIKESALNLEDLLWQTLQKSLSVLDAKNQFGYNIIKININKTRQKSAANPKYTLTLIIKSKEKTEKYSKLEAKGISKYNFKIYNQNKKFISSVVIDV